MRALLHLLGNIAPVLAGLITAPLTARGLGPAARGELAILLLVSVFIGLVGALGLGLLARQAVSEDLGQAHGWSRRGRRITYVAAVGAASLGYVLSQAMALETTESLAATVLFALAGMSASRSVDGNILIVAGRTNQYGAAGLAASLTVCVGIVLAFVLGLLELWVVIALNATSLVVQMTLIVIPVRQVLATVREDEFITETLASLIMRALRAWRSQVTEAALIRSDSVMFMTQSTVQIVGLYTVVSLVPQVAYQVYQTLIQFSYAASPTLRIRHRTRLLWQATVGAGLALSVTGGLVAFPLIPVIFGSDFTPSLAYLWPACLMTVGLAGMAPVLHHYAISQTSDGWFPLALSLSAIVSWGLGSLTSTAVGVMVLAGLLMVLSVVYIYLLSGPRAFCVSLTAMREMFKKS